MNPALAILPQEVREKAFTLYVANLIGVHRDRAILNGHYCCPLGAINMVLGVCDNEELLAGRRGLFDRHGYIPDNAVIESYLLDLVGYSVNKYYMVYLNDFIHQNDIGGFANKIDLAIAMGVENLVTENPE